MQKRRRIIILICSFLTASVVHAANIQDRQRELNNLNGSIEELKQTISENKAHQAELENALKASELVISQLAVDIKALDAEVSAREIELTKLKQMQHRYEVHLATERALLAQQVRLMYYLGKSHTIKTVLNPDHMNDVGRQLTYYRYLSNTRLKLMAEISQILDTLDNNLTTITDHENKLKVLLANKMEQQRQQQMAQAERQNIILELNRRGLDKMQQLEAMTANQFSLKNIIASLRPQASAEPAESFNLLKGKLTWPIQGKKLPLDEGEKHQPGVVISAPQGAPVEAVYGGKVIFANWLRGFGLLLIINHGDGFMSLYGRNEAIYAKVGDSVKPHQVIASIGNTGGYNKPSLYFEIRHNGQPVNPALWCR